MKNLLLALFVVTGFAACKSDPSAQQDRNIQLLPDSTAYNNSALTDSSNLKTADATGGSQATTPKTKTIIRTIVVEKAAPSREVTVQPVPQPVQTPPVTASGPVTAPPSLPGQRSETKRNDSTATSGTSGAGSTASTTTEPVQKKAGMSKATQGAIIGGVAGAVGGAVISRKKGLGAVVGGIAGAAGGYIIGKNMDKKGSRMELN